MIKTSYYLDTRSTAEGAAAPLKVRFTFKKKPVMIQLGVKLLPGQWDSGTGSVVEHPQKKRLNQFISVRLTQINTALMQLETSGELKNLSHAELKAQLEGKDPSEVKPKDNFLDFYLKVVETKKAPKTKVAYQAALSRLREFDPELASRSCRDIDYRYIVRFDDFMAQRNCANTRCDYHTCVRGVLNKALDEEIELKYPYRKFKLKREPTKKRAISVTALRALRDYPVTPAQERARDIFMLMFYLIGVNSVDLLNAPKSALRDGRFDYSRSKTHKPYSIKVEPEAQAIIDRYAGTKHMLRFMDECKDYDGWRARMNDKLKEIGPYVVSGRGGKHVIDSAFPDLTGYCSRHTWASLAAMIDIPKDTIAACMGHGSNTVTDIYIKYDYRKIDRANREVIDFVNSDKVL